MSDYSKLLELAIKIGSSDLIFHHPVTLMFSDTGLISSKTSNIMIDGLRIVEDKSILGCHPEVLISNVWMLVPEYIWRSIVEDLLSGRIEYIVGLEYVDVSSS